jgi:hypothetical protein
MLTKTQVKNNKVIVGELTSRTMLNDDIAYHYMEKLNSTTLRPTARKSNEGWIAALEDNDGVMLLFSGSLLSQEIALSKAQESLKLIRKA